MTSYLALIKVSDGWLVDFGSDGRRSVENVLKASACHIFAEHAAKKKLGVNFINILRTSFSYERHFSSFFSSNMFAETAAETTFVCKMLMKLTAGRGEQFILLLLQSVSQI